MTCKNILITGCGGFIGTNLCLKLLGEKHNVIGVDDLSTGQERNIDILSIYPNFRFIKLDITSGYFSKTVFHSHDIHEIYHLASPASPPAYQRNPIKTMMVGVVGTKNVLDVAKYFQSKILFTSTSEVYGDPQITPQTEDYRGWVNTTGKRACYDESKRAAESLMFDYKRIYNVNIRVARLFNFFGPRMEINDGRVVSNFIEQALNNKPLTIYGDGKQTRSFGYVDDCVDGLISLMNTGYSHTPVNIGNPDEIQVLQLADEVINLTNSNSVLEFKSLPEDDPKQRFPDISLAKRVMSWQPKVSRIEGLKKTIEYFKTVLYEKT